MKMQLRDPVSSSVTIGFAGDVVPGFPEYKPIAKDPRLLEIMHSCDLVVANLEAPLTGTPSAKETGVSLFSDPASVRELLEMNIKLANLGNNHIMDRGGEGLEETFHALNDKEISWMGAGKNIDDAAKPVFHQTQDQKIAFLSYAWEAPGVPSMASDKTPGANPFVLSEAKKQIATLSNEGHIVCVSYHGGEEYFHVPGPERRATLRELADAGAHMVIGHHAHFIQGVEAINDRVIAYGLGNFYMTIPVQESIRGTDIGLFLTIELDQLGPFAYSTYFVKNNKSGTSLSLVRGKKEVALQQFHDVLSNSLNDEKSYLREWRRDCFRMAMAMNNSNGPWLFRMIRMAAFIGVLVVKILFKKQNSPNHKTEPEYKSSIKDMIAAALLGFPEAIVHLRETTQCYRAYDMDDEVN